VSRGTLRRLRVSGHNKPNADIEFGPTLTFITGASNTGKSHIFGCINFALGGSSPELQFREAQGYDRVYLELATGESVVTVARRFEHDGVARWFAGPLNKWDEATADELPVKVDRAKPHDTLGGRLLRFLGFDPTDVLVKNAEGKTQAISLRTISHLFLVSENEVIATESPVAPPSFGKTAARSGFNLLLSGKAPTDREIARLRAAHKAKEEAAQHLVVLDPLIARLRHDISEAGTQRHVLNDELGQIDAELGDLSEVVTASGERVRSLLTRRNSAIAEAESARAEARRLTELDNRFNLLAQHYESDVQRLEFALESGHFFGQLEATYCPRCGRPLQPSEECHEETADFADIERSARAELKKLQPRIADLSNAIADVEQQEVAARARAEQANVHALALDDEIREVANPTAAGSRRRVKRLAARRREVEGALLRHRELDHYLAMNREADLAAKTPVESFRPIPDAASLKELQDHIRTTLCAWDFPVRSDVIYNSSTDDIVVDGKPRAANGKGVRAVMHAAFTVGLMRHSIEQGTPHAGFCVIDSPLTPFRGADEDDGDEDDERRDSVHGASLRSLATTRGQGQTIVLENIDPPSDMSGAVVYIFTGKASRGRAGFYPS
jgi:hypothetical protein